MTPDFFPPEFFTELARQRSRQKMDLMGERAHARLGDQVPGFERRPWKLGDSKRMVDWRATARANRPVVRSLEQERGGHLCLVLDRSASMAPTTQDRDVAQRRLALALIWLALEQGTRVLLFAGQASPARFAGWSRRSAAQSFLQNLSPAEGADGVDAVQQRPAVGSALHVLSDPWFHSDALRKWSLLAPGFQKRQWTSLVLPQENAPPKKNLNLVAAEGGESIQVNLLAGYAQFQAEWAAFRAAQREGLIAAGFHPSELLCGEASQDGGELLRRATRHGVL
ncbi:MAG: DUF58 domain-containing protein [Planctomycetota bacterium]